MYGFVFSDIQLYFVILNDLHNFYFENIKYFISFSDSTPTYVKLSKKSILKIFNKSKDVKNFIDKNKLNLNEISSLIEIAKYFENNY